jgi:tetratricopeptide (TPR) repeat protein
MLRAARVLLVAGLTLSAAVFAPRAHAQTTAETASVQSRILLVLPFDNGSNQPNLEWVREAAPELLTSRLLSAGFSPLSRADRRYALDHLGLPQNFHPSRATSLKLAQTLDAESIIVGSYSTNGSTITAEAQIVDVPHLRMSQPVTAQGDMHSLIAVFDSLAWELTRQLDPAFPVGEETFVAAGANLNLGAFEQYIRGIAEPDHNERLTHLQAAVKLSPDFADAWMALGREDYASQDYEHAADAFAKVTGNSPDALEASFYRGLSLLYTGNYPGAEAAFTGVARVLPLAAVLNNQGVAISRQGHDGTALFRQAAIADPVAPDYHFNLAVSLKRHGDANGATAELAQYLKLRPSDTEALDLNTAWKQPAGAGPVEPLERIARAFDAVAFRQAAAMMDQVESARLTALLPRQHADALVVHGREYLSRGLVLEASRNANAALQIDPGNAEAQALLREVAAKRSQK